MSIRVLLAFLILIAAAATFWGCSRQHSQAPLERTPATAQSESGAWNGQEIAVALDGAPPAPPTPAGGNRKEASDASKSWSHGGPQQDMLFGQRALASADTRPGDRDLGHGAGKEPLGRLEKPDADPTSREGYDDVRDNPFMRVAQAGGDASTFGLDVDTASYSNIRRHLSESKQVPPRGAVRIEEMVNYFPYAYAGPAADAKLPFGFITTLSECPWEPSHRLLRIAIKGKALDASTRPPLNLVYLIDTSGSMRRPDKLDLVKQSLSLLVDQLDARDSLAIVTYAGNAGVALAATPGDQHVRIRDVIAGLGAGGSTNGAGGIEAAYAEAAKGLKDGVQSRVVLCTDGDFNVGVSDQGGLKQLIEQKRQTGVFLSVYGFGRGNLQDHKMETLADAGNGVYGYIDSGKEARKIMVDEALGATVAIAKDAKVQVFFNPTEVAGWRLIGYENRLLRSEDFNDDTVDAGDLGASHTVTVLYEIVPAGQDVPAAPAADPNPFLSDYAEEAPGIAAGTLLRLRLRAKQPDADVSILQEEDVPTHLSAMDDDFRFAAGVALFGMLLRQSPYVGAGDYTLAKDLCSAGLGNDAQGLRAECLGLIGTATGLK